jgi:hypothetical protein
MVTRLRNRLTYANLMATIAVFIALGGTSYAVTQLDNNSVRSKHIQNGQVKRVDLGKNAVTSKKVRNHSLLAKDFRLGQLPQGATGSPGPGGPQGIQGPKGDKGDRGTDGVDGSAKAFATVEPGPGFLGASHGFVSVTRPDGFPTGVYCLTPQAGVNVVQTSAVASPSGSTAGGNDMVVQALGTVVDCPAGKLEVRTYRMPLAQPTLSNEVIFSVIIP